jgi:hypothetical protein
MFGLPRVESERQLPTSLLNRIPRHPLVNRLIAKFFSSIRHALLLLLKILLAKLLLAFRSARCAEPSKTLHPVAQSGDDAFLHALRLYEIHLDG